MGSRTRPWIDARPVTTSVTSTTWPPASVPVAAWLDSSLAGRVDDVVPRQQPVEHGDTGRVGEHLERVEHLPVVEGRGDAGVGHARAQRVLHRGDDGPLRQQADVLRHGDGVLRQRAGGPALAARRLIEHVDGEGPEGQEPEGVAAIGAGDGRFDAEAADAGHRDARARHRRGAVGAEHGALDRAPRGERDVGRHGHAVGSRPARSPCRRDWSRGPAPAPRSCRQGRWARGRRPACRR